MKKYIVLFCVIISSQDLFSQEVGKIEFTGYVNEMFSVFTENLDNSWYWQNTVHNRLTFGWQPGEYWRIDAGIRNRLFSGDFLDIPGYAKNMGKDNGYMDLSWNIMDKKNALLNMACDRLYLTFEKEKWCLKLGRQRVNWGQTFVWNANDLFNSYSFFDFDYIERPGCDAFRGTYYHNATSFSEVVVSLDHSKKVTAALLHHGTIKNFDYQVMTGIQAEDDYVVGGAFTGDVKGVNLRGEFAYRQPLDNFGKSTGIIEASFGADYLFSNQLMLQGEVMYNNKGSIFSANNILNLILHPSSANIMSAMNSWNVVGMVFYPPTDRLSLSISGMYMSGLETCFAGVIMDYSLWRNLDFSVISQYFTTVGDTIPIDARAWFGFARLKFSF
ncbi:MULTISPECIES: hypothetical protein [Butyricimonas]|uniref:hypothetical protein n=1 Tax=Butyricimonas TaxID=574697 RepID=UPI0007FB384A|nr:MULTISPECIES: hypothetical protein [Butyricimonas]